jgi:hypothetical protein
MPSLGCKGLRTHLCVLNGFSAEFLAVWIIKDMAILSSVCDSKLCLIISLLCVSVLLFWIKLKDGKRVFYLFSLPHYMFFMFIYCRYLIEHSPWFGIVFFLVHCFLKYFKIQYSSVKSYRYWQGHYFAIHIIWLLTYLLTPWSRVLLEKLTSFQLVKKFPAF